MGSLGQFLLNLFVNLKVFLEVGNFFGQVLVLKNQLLGLFGLELQLWGKLVILQHGQSCGGLELLLFEREEICAHVTDFGEHLISELVSGLDFLALFVSDFSDLGLLLLI